MRVTSCGAGALVGLAIAAGSSLIAAPARAEERDAWTISAVPHWAWVQPAGEFQPPDPTRGWGLGLQSTLVPPHRTLGVRLDAGTAHFHSSLDSVEVPFLYSTQYVHVVSETDLLWAMGGAQWDPRPRDSGVYLYATMGVLHVTPVGYASGAFLVTPDPPGLPPTSNHFACAAGVGSRFVFGKAKLIAITGELEYRRAEAADYVGPPGVVGTFPNNHFSVRHGAVETVTARIGVGRMWNGN